MESGLTKTRVNAYKNRILKRGDVVICLDTQFGVIGVVKEVYRDIIHVIIRIHDLDYTNMSCCVRYDHHKISTIPELEYKLKEYNREYNRINYLIGCVEKSNLSKKIKESVYDKLRKTYPNRDLFLLSYLEYKDEINNPKFKKEIELRLKEFPLYENNNT